MLMYKILDISIFGPGVYSTVFIRLNSILALSSNLGDFEGQNQYMSSFTNYCKSHSGFW